MSSVFRVVCVLFNVWVHRTHSAWYDSRFQWLRFWGHSVAFLFWTKHCSIIYTVRCTVLIWFRLVSKCGSRQRYSSGGDGGASHYTYIRTESTAEKHTCASLNCTQRRMKMCKSRRWRSKKNTRKAGGAFKRERCPLLMSFLVGWLPVLPIVVKMCFLCRCFSFSNIGVL